MAFVLEMKVGSRTRRGVSSMLALVLINSTVT
jgi:hypothetical protein